MKKIFITAHSMDIGGAEQSLLGLLENIDYSRYSVDLFLLRRQGELLKYVPKEVNLLPMNSKYAALGISVKDALKQHQLSIVMARIIGKYAAIKRIKELQFDRENNVINEYSHKYTVNYLPRINKVEYDIAISFVSPHYIVANKVTSKKKIAWIHTDYSTLGVDVDSEYAMWNRYDKIISISESVTDSFLRTFPLLKSKIYIIENILPHKYMMKLTDAFGVDEEISDYDGMNILSIGRFSPQKRFTDIPQVCRLILDAGVRVRWYLIGFGMEEKAIRDNIIKYHVQDNVIILGKKENPYPYIKKCDVYIQPSNYEGKSIAVREAQIFHKPVIITNYSTANSQLENGVDGIIVPMDLVECATAIAGIISDRGLLEKVSKNTYGRDYINVSEIEKFYSLIEELV